jgi:hypothetical protein
VLGPEPLVEKEFDIIREIWSSYDLEDGTLLRSRTILMKVMGPKKMPKQGRVALNFVFHQLNVVTASPGDRGKPNPTPVPLEELQRLKKDEVDVVTEREGWNIYRLKGVEEPKRLKTKVVVSSVFRIPKQFDQEGNPMYIINSATIVAPASAKELEEG